MGELAACEIIFEDEDILVLNKPYGVSMHRSHLGQEGRFVTDFLRLYLPGAGYSGSDLRFGIVHRLDRDTSGVLVCAKSEGVRERLQGFFKQRRVKKHYLALVRGRLYHDFELRNYLKRNPVRRMRRMVVGAEELARFSGGELPGRYREAITFVCSRETFARSTLVDLFPETGRTHQLRVQLSAIKHPVLGDRLYSSSGIRSPLFLLSLKIDLPHPRTLKLVHFEVGVPNFFREKIVEEREA